ncbi:MAG: hypothetical protein ABIJ42_01750, partial [Acidobacteriota bacterium]
MKRKIAKRLLIMAGGLFILITLALSFFHLPFVKLKILSSIQQTLQKNQGIHLSVETFDYNLLNLTFFLKGVRLEKTGKEDFPPILRADAARLKIPFSILFNRKLRIKDVEVINPEINISIDRHGGNNLPFQSRPAEVPQVQANLPEFIILRAMVENGQVHFSDERQNLDLLISGIWVRGVWMGEGKHSVHIETRLPGSVSFGHRFFPLEKSVLQAVIDKAGIDIEELLITLSGSDLALSGRVNDCSSPVFEGTCKGRLNLDVIGTAIESSETFFSGTLDFQSELSGPLKDLSARIQVESGDLAYGKWANIQLNSDISWQEKVLEIRSLELRDGRGQVHAKGSLHPLEWSSGNHLNIEWEGLDAAPFSDAFNSPYPLSSVSSGAMEVSWNGFSQEKITGECEILLGGNGGQNVPGGRAEITGKILARSDSNGIHTTFQDITMLGARLQSDLLLNPDEISGNFKLDVRSIAGIIPVIRAFSKGLDEGMIQELGLDGPLSVSGLLAGNLEKPVVTFDVESDNLEILSVKNIGIKGNIFYDGRSVGIESLRVQDEKGKFRITGDYPLASSGLPMHFEAEGEDLPLERVIGLFNIPVEATGIIAVSATVEGKMESPKINVKGVISDGLLYGQTIEKLEFIADYRDKKLVLDNLSVPQLPGLLEAEGFYDTFSKEFSINLKADSFPLHEVSLPGTSELASAAVDIDFAASGILENPDIKAKGSLRNTFIGTRDLGDLPFEIQTRSDGLAFHVKSPVFSSSIDGSISQGNPRLLKLEINTDRMPLEVFQERIFFLDEQDFSGLLTSQVSLKLDLEAPENTIDANAKIEQIQFRTGQHLIQNKGPILLSYKEDAFHIEKLVLTGTGAEIEAKGILASKESSASRLWVNADVDLSMLGSFFPDVDTTGSLRIESEFRGSLKNPDIYATLEVSGAQLQYASMPFVLEEIQSRIMIKENVIGIDSLTLRLDDSEIVIEGNIPLESLPLALPEFFSVHGDREADLKVHFQDFDPTVLALIYSREMAQSLSGRLSGELELKGKQLQPDKIFGTAHFDTFELIASGIPLKQKDGTLVQLEKGVLSFQNFVLLDGDNRFDLRGTADITGSGEIDLILRGEFALSRLRKFDKKNIFSGKALFELYARDSYSNPSIHGFLDVRDGRMQRMNPRIFLEKVNGQIKFTQNRLE